MESLKHVRASNIIGVLSPYHNNNGPDALGVGVNY